MATDVMPVDEFYPVEVEQEEKPDRIHTQFALDRNIHSRYKAATGLKGEKMYAPLERFMDEYAKSAGL